MTKTLLLLAIVLMLIGGAVNLGLIAAHDNAALYALFPTGASFFGLFLIVRVLGRESERYDREHNKTQPATAKIAAK